MGSVGPTDTAKNSHCWKDESPSLYFIVSSCLECTKWMYVCIQVKRQRNIYIIEIIQLRNMQTK